MPTLYRRLQNKGFSDTEIDEDLVSRYEMDLLCEANGIGYYLGDRLTTIITLQHHGGATRLLDITRSPLTALWFATSSTPEEVDGVVYHYSAVPGCIYEQSGISSWDDLVAKEHSGQPIVFFPNKTDERIKAQNAGFLTTVLGAPLSSGTIFSESTGSLEVEQFIIPWKLKATLRKYLQSSFGLTDVTVYPDFEGFAQANSPLQSFPRQLSQLNTDENGMFPNQKC